MMRLLIFFVVVLDTMQVMAQTVMTVDKTEAVIGDQLKVTITTNLSEGREWRNMDDIWPDTIQGIEIVSGPELDQKNPASSRATWSIAVFDTGWVRIPSLFVVIRQSNSLDTIMTNDIPVMVKSIEPDSTGLLPIKDIVRQPFSLVYYKKYIPHLLIALLLLAGLYYWWRKRNQKPEIPEVVVPEPLPHEWALAELDKLEAKKLWQSGSIKEHYTYLTAILREYLERRYGIHAMEQTSEEIIRQLKLHQLSPALQADTEELLAVSDQIKFAKANPGEDIHAMTIARVRTFIMETMIVEIPETQNEDGPVE